MDIALVIGHSDIWRVENCNLIARQLAAMKITPVFIYSTSNQQWEERYPALKAARNFKETWFNQILIPYLDALDKAYLGQAELLTPAGLAKLHSPKEPYYVARGKKGGREIHQIATALEAEGHNITCVISADTYAILAKETLESWPTVGVHPAPLPAFPDLFGTAKQAMDQLLQKQRIFTATIHKLHAELDHGQIVTTAQYDGTGNNSLFDIRSRLYTAGTETMMKNVVPALIHDGDFRNLTLTEQDPQAIALREQFIFLANWHFEHLSQRGGYAIYDQTDIARVMRMFIPSKIMLDTETIPKHIPTSVTAQEIDAAVQKDIGEWTSKFCASPGAFGTINRIGNFLPGLPPFSRQPG